MSKRTLGDILSGLESDDLKRLTAAFDEASEQESDLEPKQIREIEPVRPWLRSKYYNSFSKNLYPYWEEEIVDFIEGHYSEWVISGSLGTGKSSAALVAVARKLYELSCWDWPQRLFRLADMTKIFFAYLSVNLKQADLTGFGQLRSMMDATPYFVDTFNRDQNINSVLKYPKGLFVIPGSDQISVIGTNLFGVVLDEANFYRKSGMSAIGDVHKAQELYVETSDRRRSRFMHKGKDPGFSLLVSSSTVQSSFTSARIEKADDRTKVTVAALWEVKKSAYSEKTFYVFNGSDKDDPFVVERPHDLDDLIFEESDRARIRMEVEASCIEDPNDQVSYCLQYLPDYVQFIISEIPVDFRQSFETDLFKALRNIAGVSIAPVGKLFTSRMLWQRALSPELYHPFTKATQTIGLNIPGEIADIFKFDRFFGKDAPVRHPSSPRFIHIDQCTTDATNSRLGISCVHVAEWVVNRALGSSHPVIEMDFCLAVDPPKPPDRIALYKIRNFVLQLRQLGMILGRVTFDQHQSEDAIQLLTKAHVQTGRVSVDKDDKPYLSLVNLFNESRIHLYDYPLLKSELFNLDHDREKCKVDHPDKNPDGSHGSKDAADSLAGACFTCLEGGTSTHLERLDALNKIDMRVPEIGYDKDCNFDWMLPKEYRGHVEIEPRIVGGGGWDLSNRYSPEDDDHS